MTGASSAATGAATLPAATRAGRRSSTVVATGSGADGRAELFTGWRTLLALVLRRDRVRLVIWVAAIAALVLVSAASIKGLYPNPESLATYSALAGGNAAVVVQAGPGYGLDAPTVGAVLMNETSIWAIILVGLMSIFMVTRHTRAEEESERAELLRATVLGRHAAGVSTMAGVLLANLAVAVVVVVGLVVAGLDTAGSLAFGATLVGAGLVFAGITLVTAQVAATSRAATGLALVVLGASFVLRAVGDVRAMGDGGSILSWLSPIGWAQAIRAFADERWWVLLLPTTATVGLLVAASVLAARRDFGSGLLPDRVGRAGAGPLLASPLGLAARLQRGALIGWAAGVAVLGVFYGVITSEAEQMVVDNPDIAQFLAQAGGASITDSFLAVAVLMIGLLAAGYTVAAVLRLHSEETAGRIDPLLATPTSRPAWASSHLVVAGVGMIVVLTIGGLGLGVGAAAALAEPGRILQMAGAALAMAPAVAVLGALAFALACVTPRWSLLAWLGVAVAVVVGLFAEVLDLPQWVRDISPLQHVPPLPAADLTIAPLVALGLVAAALVVTGLVGVRHRDMGRG